MLTSLYIIEAKLNKEDKDYKHYLCILNTEGVLLVDKGLFSLSFESITEFKNQIDYKNVKPIGDVNLIA